MIEQNQRHEAAIEGTPASNMERPSAIVFDGVCNLCNGFIRFVIRYDRHRRFVFLPLQAVRPVDEPRLSDVAEWLPGTSILLLQNGEIFSKSSAVLRIVAGFGGVWSVARVALLTPKLIRDLAYDLVARNRYRMFGRRDECMVPTTELQSRFRSISSELEGASDSGDAASSTGAS